MLQEPKDDHRSAADSSVHEPIDPLSSTYRSYSPTNEAMQMKDKTNSAIRLPQKWIVTDEIVTPFARPEVKESQQRVSLESGVGLASGKHSARLVSQKPKWSEQTFNSRSARPARAVSKGTTFGQNRTESLIRFNCTLNFCI
jgi:hypothetical protein